MRPVIRSRQGERLRWALAGLVLLGWTALAAAQTGGTGLGGGGAGGFGAGGGGGGLGGGASGSNAFQGGQALQGGLGALGQSGGVGQTGSDLAGKPIAPGGTGGTSGYGATSFMGPFYVNPLTFGLPTNSSSSGGGGTSGRGSSTTGSFGTPLYANISSTTSQFGATAGGANRGTTSTGGRGTTSSTSRTGSRTTSQLGGAAGRAGGTANVFQGGGLGVSGGGMNSGAAMYAQAFTTEIAFAAPAPPTPAQVRADLQAMIRATPSLPSRERIEAVTQGDVLVLRGSVDSDYERRLAEALIRLTPGVFNVRNDLAVKAPPKP